jgi:broad specificity phosphatase PhoE/ribonuclease HI
VARLVIEADGGSRGNPGPAGYGAVVRDWGSGEVLREVAGSVGVATNNVAEYRGLIAGLSAAADLDPGADVEVRMDSKLVVEQMSGRWKVKHTDMRVLAGEAAELVRKFPSVRFVHVRREFNSHADRLANEAMDAAADGRAWAPRNGSPAPVTAPAVATPAGPPSGWLAGRRLAATLLLARHGATELSAQSRFCGVTDLPLTERGRAQAERLASAVSSIRPAAVVSSPLRRAVETADAVGRRCGSKVEVVEELRETDFGAWEGLTVEEVAAGWPDELARWRADPRHPAPTGESFAQTAERVASARARIVAENPGGAVVVVSHVTPLKALVCWGLGLGMDALFRLHLDVASLSWLDVLDDGTGLLRRLNDVAHL